MILKIFHTLRNDFGERFPDELIETVEVGCWNEILESCKRHFARMSGVDIQQDDAFLETSERVTLDLFRGYERLDRTVFHEAEEPTIQGWRFQIEAKAHEWKDYQNPCRVALPAARKQEKSNIDLVSHDAHFSGEGT